MLLNLKQTAEKLGCSTTEITRLVEGGALPTVPYGKPDGIRRAWRFSEDAIRTFRKGLSHPVNGTSTTAMPVSTPPPPAPPENGLIPLRKAAKILGWKYQRLVDMRKRATTADFFQKINGHLFITAEEIEHLKTLPKAGWAKRPGRHAVAMHKAAQTAPTESSVPSNRLDALDVEFLHTQFELLHTQQNGIYAQIAALSKTLQAISDRLDALEKMWA